MDENDNVVGHDSKYNCEFALSFDIVILISVVAFLPSVRLDFFYGCFVLFVSLL